MKPVAVAIENVALHFGATQVLRDINLKVEPGEFFALLGPSGSGKSTLLRLIAGFNRNQAGRVLIDGRDVSAVPPWQRNVGMVFQNYALWPHMTVAQNIAFGLEERRLPTADIKRRVAAVVDLVELTGLEQRHPGQLSGGQQQRVAIARTLAIEPQLLLLDEPLSNLDAKLRLQTRQELKKLQRRLNITTLFVTHDQEEALTTCDRIAVLVQWVFLHVGTPLELFDHPQNRFVSQFIGSTNLFAGQFLAGDTGPSFASPALGLLALPSALVAPSEPSDIAFRPHAVRLCSAEQPPMAGHLQLSGVVHNQEFLGAFLRYEVRVGSALVLADQAHVRGQPSLPLGTAVSLLIPATEIRFMRL